MKIKMITFHRERERKQKKKINKNISLLLNHYIRGGGKGFCEVEMRKQGKERGKMKRGCEGEMRKQGKERGKKRKR